MKTNSKAKTYQEQQREKLRVLRREIRKGLEDLKHGRVVSPARAFAELDKVLHEKAAAARKK